jgi:transposase
MIDFFSPKRPKIDTIIDLIDKDGETTKEYQFERDLIVKNIVKDIKNTDVLIRELEEQLEKLIPITGYKLSTISGINTVTEASLISEIGDINCFSNSDKLARFMVHTQRHF